jgi:hypothetical protein
LFPTRRSPASKVHWTFARGSPQCAATPSRHRLRARCGPRRRASSGQSPWLPRRRCHQGPPLSALPVGCAHRPSVPHPATRLPPAEFPPARRLSGWLSTLSRSPSPLVGSFSDVARPFLRMLTSP